MGFGPFVVYDEVVETLAYIIVGVVIGVLISAVAITIYLRKMWRM